MPPDNCANSFDPAISKTRRFFTALPCAARALLITRGIEAPTDFAVFENFAKHFIHAGLIDRRFESMIQNAHQNNNERQSHMEEEVYALLHAVEALYRSMASPGFPRKQRSQLNGTTRTYDDFIGCQSNAAHRQHTPTAA
jgi:uncharacterized protein (UPF0332 family)